MDKHSFDLINQRIFKKLLTFIYELIEFSLICLILQFYSIFQHASDLKY